MREMKILIVGAYGAVGVEAVKILSALPQFKVYVGGRNPDKAKKVASDFNCNWRYIDVDEKSTIKEALVDIDIVVNCFISMSRVDVTIAEMVADNGAKYIDIAGLPIDHQYKIKELSYKAENSGALLITACGINPGITGILLKHHVEQLVEIEKSEILFTMGANFNDISVLSLIGIGELMLIPPKIWKGGKWIAPKKYIQKEYIGEPFNKKIYFNPGTITPDISGIPNKHKINQIEFWSGIENFWTSMSLYFGVKLGKTETNSKASHFLNRLKQKGNKKKYHSESHLMLRSSGVENGQPSLIESSFYCTEVFATALAPAIVCSLIYEGSLNATGAFYAAEVINPKDFVAKLKESNVNYKASFEKVNQ